jgi:hypothetical protein
MTLMTMTASPAHFDYGTIADRARTVARRFIGKVIGGGTYQLEGEIVEYLDRHQHDLPPELRIMLERRFLGP